MPGSSKVGKNSSFPADQERRILDRLSRDGQVNATVLAEEFSTSEDMIRRDLRELAGRGLCQRVYGGAVVISPGSTPIAVRVDESNDRKEALGRTLATLLRPKQFVYIDAGSTNLAFARVLPHDLPLTSSCAAVSNPFAVMPSWSRVFSPAMMDSERLPRDGFRWWCGRISKTAGCCGRFPKAGRSIATR